MALRWRKDGVVLCAATSRPKDGDAYINDFLHYWLAVEQRFVIPADDETTTGRWYWAAGVEVFEV